MRSHNYTALSQACRVLCLLVFSLLSYATEVKAQEQLLIVRKDGKEIRVPTSQIDSITFARRRSENPTKPKSKLAIEYLAQYNMGSESSFATSHRNDASKYFSYQDACSRFATIQIEGRSWHLPSVEEWRGIFPSNEGGEMISFAYTQCKYNVAEAIEVGGLRRSYLADYNSVDKTTCYALKFKSGDKEISPNYPPATDNGMLCAYKYELVGDFKKANNPDSYLLVSVCYLGETFTGSIHTISSEQWWTDYKQLHPDLYFERKIPASGWYKTAVQEGQKDEVVSIGTGGRYWSSSTLPGSTEYAWALSYYATKLRLLPIHSSYCYAVRLFSDK